MAIDFITARVELLSDDHDRSTFSCGVGSLDKYLQVQAGQDMKRKVAVTFVMTLPEGPERILGYYTLSSTAIDPGVLAPAVQKKLPRYPLVPATLLGRLARDAKYKSSGIGEHLLIDALIRSYEHSREIASFAIVVDAIDAKAHAWYAKKWGFIPFEDQRDRLYLPMKTIEKLIPFWR